MIVFSVLDMVPPHDFNFSLVRILLVLSEHRVVRARSREGKISRELAQEQDGEVRKEDGGTLRKSTFLRSFFS